MAQIETTLRGPEAYDLARRVIDEMAAAKVWPTPVNFEIWLHYIGDPEGPLGREIRRLLDAQSPITEDESSRLATLLPRARLTEEIQDAGRVLDRELTSVANAIAEAHRSQAAYGVTLADASESMQAAASIETLQTVVAGLAAATNRVQDENRVLEKRLEQSTGEISRLREHLEQVRRDAMTDALTSLANRKAFDEQLEAACTAADKGQKALTLAVIDIDHFKRFNDTWGHQTGDQVLRYVASVLARYGREPRTAARYGGEEFALIMPGDSLEDVQSMLENIRREISSRSLRRRSTNDELGAVTISVGYAMRLPGESASLLLERADAALYASKHGGRNRVTAAHATEEAA